MTAADGGGVQGGGRTVEANGLSFHVQEAGEGPAVILLHGFPDSSHLWRRQLPALAAAGFRAVAPDLRGAGRSQLAGDVGDYRISRMASDVVGIADALGIGDFSVVGHDWGGSIAFGLAGKLPERVQRLVALSTGHPAAFNRAGMKQQQKSWYMLWFLFDGVAEELLPRDDWALLRRWMGRYLDVERAIADLSEPGRLEAALNWYRANIRPETFVLEDVMPVPPARCPTLGVWSRDDAWLTEEQMLLSALYVEGPWRYERIEEAGHWIPLDAPDRLNDLLVEFLTD